MFGHRKQPIDEHQARGETSRIYHEIRQTLRVSGVNLNFRTWAAFPRFFSAMWAAMQPVAASRTFESASDALRARAADLALTLPILHVRAPLGESQRFQIERALALYHYINPKLLLFTVLVRRGLAGERQESSQTDPTELEARVPFGPPSGMAAMEMVAEKLDDRRLRPLFGDIIRTLQLSSINSDYRTLALWPDYLEPAWAALKPVVRMDAYRQAADALGGHAQSTAGRLPTPSGIEFRRLAAQGENTTALMAVTEQFERLLPALILNIGLFARDWWPEERLRSSPYPLTARPEMEERP
jgi:hypothetical protein